MGCNLGKPKDRDDDQVLPVYNKQGKKEAVDETANATEHHEETVSGGNSFDLEDAKEIPAAVDEAMES